ncbi:hypothetical protein AN958_10655 [Leucoagaricus sp. SymC.cos]|nr:hypothetical protein AN958_10655 [Leucoagaricus sp. SymC.cos]
MTAKTPASSNVVFTTEDHPTSETSPSPTRVHAPSEASAQTVEAMSSPCCPCVYIVNLGIEGLTKADLTFTHKEVEFFTWPVTLEDLEGDSTTIYLSSDSELEVEVAAILSCSPITLDAPELPIVKSNGPDLFEEARQYHFRGVGLPEDADDTSGPIYVVFCGLEPGLYRDSSAVTAQVTGVSNTHCHRFSTLSEAMAEWNFARSNCTAGYVSMKGYVIVECIYSLKPLKHYKMPDLISIVRPPPVKWEQIKTKIEAAKAQAIRPAIASKGKGKVEVPKVMPNTIAEARVAFKKALAMSNAVPMINMVTVGQAESIVVQNEGTSSQAMTHTDAAPKTRFNPNEQIWVMLKGEKPGVYKNREKAESEGIGSADPTQVLVTLVADEIQGNTVFVKTFGQGLIEYL